MKKLFETIAFRWFRLMLRFKPRPTVATQLTVDYAIVTAWYLANEPWYRLLTARRALAKLKPQERMALSQEALVRVQANKVVEQKRAIKQARKRRFEGK